MLVLLLESLLEYEMMRLRSTFQDMDIVPVMLCTMLTSGKEMLCDLCHANQVKFRLGRIRS